MFVSLAVFCTTERVRCLLRCPQSTSLDVPGLNLDSLCIFFAKKKNPTEFKCLTPTEYDSEGEKKKKSLSHSALRLCNRKRGPVLLILSSDKSGNGDCTHHRRASLTENEPQTGVYKRQKKNWLTRWKNSIVTLIRLKSMHMPPHLGFSFFYFSFFFCFILSATIWRQLRNV